MRFDPAVSRAISPSKSMLPIRTRDCRRPGVGVRIPGGRYAAAVITAIVLVHVALAAIGLYVQARREVLASLRERAERAEAAQHEHAERVRLAERARIAREMHDVLAHRLSLLSVHAGALEFRPDAPPAGMRAAPAPGRDRVLRPEGAHRPGLRRVRPDRHDDRARRAELPAGVGDGLGVVAGRVGDCSFLRRRQQGERAPGLEGADRLQRLGLEGHIYAVDFANENWSRREDRGDLGGGVAHPRPRRLSQNSHI